MTVVCVVQARTGSSRLPGKVLMDLGGVPMLGFMLRRIGGLDGLHVVVATSEAAGDDAVEECAWSFGCDVVRGDETDVLDRFRVVLDRHPADDVVRLTADCPLVDPELVAEVIERHRSSGADYTSNTLIRTHPDGLDVEVVDAGALRLAADEAVDPPEREHVTPFLYRRPDRFRLASWRAPGRYGHLRWTVDTGDDLDRVRAMVASSSVRDDGWLATLTRLDPADRTPLSDGFEPAVAGEVPAASGPHDDPADQLLVYRRGGRQRGWARVRLVDRDAGTVEGEADPDVLDRAQDDLRALLGSTLQFDPDVLTWAAWRPTAKGPR